MRRRPSRSNSLDEVAPWHKPPRKRDIFADLYKRTGVTARPDDIDSAAKIWRMWHQKEPRKILSETYTFPKTAFEIGKADRILYSSDKWEDDGDFYTYYHDFDSHPEVYTTARSPLAEGLSRRNVDKIDVPATLGMEDVNSRMAFPILAKTMELKFTDLEGKKHSKKIKGRPWLCCAHDSRTIVILAKEAPIIIAGGQMVITERGIVR